VSPTWSSTEQVARPATKHSTRPIGDLWRRAVDRGHGGATTRWHSQATRTWWWWWWTCFVVSVDWIVLCYRHAFVIMRIVCVAMQFSCWMRNTQHCHRTRWKVWDFWHPWQRTLVFLTHRRKFLVPVLIFFCLKLASFASFTAFLHFLLYITDNLRSGVTWQTTSTMVSVAFDRDIALFSVMWYRIFYMFMYFVMLPKILIIVGELT